MYKENTTELIPNAFGKLVKLFREQKQWSQATLAEQWGHTREYISLIERGERHVEKVDERMRLADILGIPTSRLEALGKGIPVRSMGTPEHHKKDESIYALLKAFIAQGETLPKLSFLSWLHSSGTQDLTLHSFHQFEQQLHAALDSYFSEFRDPALKILSTIHEMQGIIHFDHMNTTLASGHFQEMADIGEELHDPNILVSAQTHRADLLRKRGRHETASRLLTSLTKTLPHVDDSVRGPYFQILARTNYSYGNEQAFLDAIDKAETIARSYQTSLNTTYRQFTLTEVLQERAHGYTTLWKPDLALTIYTQTDTFNPLRPARDLGSYLIIKAQAHAFHGDMETGVDLAIEGLRLARSYGSKRHISRVQGMYDRLRVTKFGKHARMNDLKEALIGGE